VEYLVWGAFLLLQNAAFTFVSRARNSGSYGLHAIAAVTSNGVFIMAQFISLGIMIDVVKSGTWGERIFICSFYTLFTVVGSLAMHWVSINYIETGKRKVGA
jgi:hypothetical protein